MVNKFFYNKGGSETYYFALKKMLEIEGHTVIDFSMKDDKNFSSSYSKYFVDHVDYNGKMGLGQKLKAAKKIIYSKEAKKRFEQIVIAEKPDIVHLHNFHHQFSPSILDVIKKYKIPAVYTAHDLKMICPNYKMMHHGRICEDCKGGKYSKCAKNRCVKDSFSKSCINVVEGYLHKWRKSYDAIGAIITPSKFYREKFIEFGIQKDRVFHIPNFLNAQKPAVNPTNDSEQYYLYFGRLSEEKGILTLIKAVESMNVHLKIVGTGPLKEEISQYLVDKNISNIDLLGFKSGQELTDIVGNAKAVVLPSEWYENGPYSAIESLQLGRPIIGADIGGIPELIHNNGFLFKPGNEEDLSKAFQDMEQLSVQKYEDMKAASVALFNKYYTWGYHYKQLKQIYDSVMKKEEV